MVAPAPGLGIVGYGWAATMHAEAAVAAGIPIVAVTGPRPDKRTAFAAKYGAAPADTLEGLLARDDVGAVVICSPNAHHFPQAMAAIEAGKDVLVEKPVVTSLPDAATLRTAAARAGRIVAVGHMWRYRDEVVAMRDRVRAGDFGSVVRTHGYGVHAKWGPSGWFTDPDLAGGGALIDMGIHAIDTARFLLDDPLPVRVQASIGAGCFSDSAVDDDGLVIVDWNNGTRSLVEFGWWQPVLNGLEAETEIIGRTGSARIWPDYADYPSDYQHCTVPMYRAQMEDFASACRDRSEPACSLAVGIIALQIVAEAYEAATNQALPHRHIATWEHQWHE